MKRMYCVENDSIMHKLRKRLRNQWEFEGSESSSSCDSDEEIYQKYDSSNDEDANEQQNHEQLESKLKEIREFRNKGRVPMSLALLSIKTVTNNCSKFIDTPHSPLKYLLVQQFLELIVTDMGRVGRFIPDRMPNFHIPVHYLRNFLQLLINPRVTEIDCAGFVAGKLDREFHNFLLEHALTNCPNITKVNLLNKILMNEWPKPPNKNRGSLPLKRFKQSWKQLLCIISAGSDFIFNDQTLQSIHQNFPSIECLTLTLNEVSPARLNHLMAMDKLHTLDLCCIHDFTFVDQLRPFLVKLAGEVPNLQELSFTFRKDLNEFVEQFAQQYPHKNLLVNQLIIKTGLKVQWPRNLRVRSLRIENSLTEIDMHNLNNINFELELVFMTVLVDQVYQLLELNLGQLVTSLELIILHDYPGDSSPVVLERVLAACPNLHKFDYLSPERVVKDPKYNLPPEAFKNYTDFLIMEKDMDSLAKNDANLLEIYEKYLKGTKKCTLLVLKDCVQIEMAAKVVLANPMLLQQLQEVHIGFYIRYSYYGPLYSRIIDLLSSCQKLRKVVVEYTLPIEWMEREFCKYLKPIRAIDPDVMEYIQHNSS